jgi:para-nitrobenzyl esterase
LAALGDVVVVTIDFRLGVFGFFAHPGLPGSGSFGLQDQQAALRWVRANAAAFGGDPHNVTLFGESGGGIGVCTQLTSPTSEGLFDKAILQSGACMAVEPAIWPQEDTPRTKTEPVFDSLAEVEARGGGSGE